MIEVLTAKGQNNLEIMIFRDILNGIKASESL